MVDGIWLIYVQDQLMDIAFWEEKQQFKILFGIRR